MKEPLRTYWVHKVSPHEIAFPRKTEESAVNYNTVCRPLGMHEKVLSNRARVKEDLPEEAL